MPLPPHVPPPPPGRKDMRRSNSSSSNGSGNSQQQQQQKQPVIGLGARISQNIEMAKKGYEQLVHAIIRPPRAHYKMEQLGPAHFSFLGRRYQRDDVELLSSNTTQNHAAANNIDGGDKPTCSFLKMQVSIWTRVDETDTTNDDNDTTQKYPKDKHYLNNDDDEHENGTENDSSDEQSTKKKKKKKINTMVVYLHGNASARVEVVPSLSFLLGQVGVFGVVGVDFTGSGKSDGDYVSLGYYEKVDLDCLLQHLQRVYGQGNGDNNSDQELEVVLWGRSMGASTALMYAGQQNNNNSSTTRSTIAFKKNNDNSNSTININNNSYNNNKEESVITSKDSGRNEENDYDATATANATATATATEGKGNSNVYTGKSSVITNDNDTNTNSNSNTINEENTTLNHNDDTNTKTKTNTNSSIIKGMICDSPFASLTILCEELVERARENGVMVPGVIVSVAIALIARSVRLLANFNIRDITPIEDVAHIQQIPALFVVGADDDFIPPHHSERLVEAYTKGVTTNLFMIPGGHNDARPKVVYHGIEEFCKQRLSIPTPERNITIPAGMIDSIHQNPPWAYRRTIHFQEHPNTSSSTTGSNSNHHRPTLRRHDKEEATIENASSSSSVPVSAADTAAAELGMTKDRQDDIQDKIGMLMLGKK